ncbi:HD domain-containing protein [uncultured Maritimibacter sp.]|jgi:HD superfamily phosphohydrolase YqeK|uniref:HD domain-containing protein n=1 Tax=uncultured Maritimibacter sp. TaxID=991866 RepID=UPI000AAADF28|nr:HD domain-containing protein [uncultured Maritimibacter sp.]
MSEAKSYEVLLEDGVFLPRDLPLWEAAKPYLDVRNNDEHTVGVYALARMLLRDMPEADESVVLPAVVLHDVGWKTVPEEELFNAIGSAPTRLDLVREHEVRGREIAAEILDRVKPEGVDIDHVLAIIDGHDTRDTAISPSDAVMKDADKAWRLTPNGIRLIKEWYGDEATDAWFVEMVERRSNPKMLTPVGIAFARAITASLKADMMLDRYMGGSHA